MNIQKEIWFSVNQSTKITTLEKVLNLSYSTILIPIESINILDDLKLPQRIKLAFVINSCNDIHLIEKRSDILEKLRYCFCSNTNLLQKIKDKTNFKNGFIINVNDKKSLDDTVKLAPQVDNLIVEFSDPTNIPLELILASSQSSKTFILKKVKNAVDGEVSFMTMESGSNGILLDSDNINEIIKLDNVFNNISKVKIQFKNAIVTKIKHAGMGDRVCVDTTSILTTNEGMLIGSTSNGGIMVCSETHYLPYMNLRPFRVNAGGLHSYIWGPDNHVAYLSDLKAGDQILSFNSDGEGRVVTVGRIKIERRPLLQIEAEIENQKINLFIQDDWHVRVFGSKGEIRPSSEIIIGDKLLGYLDEPGRHVGIKINETINEQ